MRAVSPLTGQETGPATGTAPAPPDVSVILTGHQEGELCAPTFAALARAIEEAAGAGISVEVVGVLDRADEATSAIFASAVAEGGIIGRLASAWTIATDHGDPGAARNEGVRHTHAPWVCVLDADNLPSRTWLRDAFHAGHRHGAPCVIHPEQLVIFGDRWQVWPQLSSNHPGFNAHNFFDRTYWDTFCLASRAVFDAHPYSPTTAALGLGPEDWHWGMATIHAHVPHLAASGTALLYRSKPQGSVQRGHEAARSLLPPSALLVDPALAASASDQPGGAKVAWRGLQRAIVRHSRGRAVVRSLPAPAPSGWRRRQICLDHVRFLYPDLADLPDPQVRRLVHDSAAESQPRRGRLSDEELAALADPVFNPLHYRALNAPALRLTNAQATIHYLDIGRAAGMRARLSEAELRDVRELDLDDYRSLHVDLADLDDAALLHHYLAHGRGEGRDASMTVEQRDAGRRVTLEDDLIEELHALHAIEPDIPEPTTDCLRALQPVGPPSDGSMTRGSRVWWQVVDALGPDRPDVMVFASHLSADPDWSTLSRVLSEVASGRRVMLLATGQDLVRPAGVGQEVALIDLPELEGWHRLTDDERRRLMATLVVQYSPDMVLVCDSPEFSAALSEYETALRASTSVRVVHADCP